MFSSNEVVSSSSVSKPLAQTPLSKSVNWLAGEHRIQQFQLMEQSARVNDLGRAVQDLVGAVANTTANLDKLTGMVASAVSTAVQAPAPSTPAAAVTKNLGDKQTPEGKKRRRKKNKKKPLQNLNNTPSSTAGGDTDVLVCGVGAIVTSGVVLQAKEDDCKAVTFGDPEFFHTNSDTDSPVEQEDAAKLELHPEPANTTLVEHGGSDDQDFEVFWQDYLASCDVLGITTKENDIADSAATAETQKRNELFEGHIESLTAHDSAKELANTLLAKDGLTSEELAVRICKSVLRERCADSYDEATGIISGLYLDLQSMCVKIGIDTFEADLNHAFRERLSYALDELDGGDTEHTSESLEVLFDGKAAWCVDTVSASIRAGVKYQNPDFDSNHELSEYSDYDLYDLEEATQVPMSPTPLLTSARLFVPEELPTNIAEPNEPDEATDSDSVADSEQAIADGEFMLMFVRPQEADGEVEIQSPQWVRDCGFPLLAPGIYGSATTWARMTSAAKDRLKAEALVFIKEHNGTSWDEWYPQHIRYLKRLQN